MVKVVEKVALLTADIWDPVYIFLYRLFSKYKGPIPSLKNRRRVGSICIGRFIEAGYKGYEPIMNEIKKCYKSYSDLKILDFGAGVGRTLMHFKKEFKNIYACDVDESACMYLLNSFNGVEVTTNSFRPPLVYSNDFFDIVYSVSVWTHLPTYLQETWLKEINRVLKTEGYAYITTSGFEALELRRKRDMEWKTINRADLMMKGIIYIEYPSFKPLGRDFPGIDESYGLTAHSPDYIYQTWSKYFRVIDIKEAIIDNIQDLVILRKAI